jgi:hypothetical protein
MIVDHPASQEKLHLSADRKNVLGQLPVHGLLGNYHWARLNAQHVLVTADYSIASHVALAVHPAVSVLPVISSGKTLFKHLNNRKDHLQALIDIGIDDEGTMSDFIEIAESRYGPIFSPEK